MTIHHHVGDDLLLAYGAGTLGEAMSLFVATHLALCPACRAGLGVAEAIGGAMIESGHAGTAPGSTGSADALLAAVTGDPKSSLDPVASVQPVAPGPFVLPQPLRDYAGGDAGCLRWRPVGGGIRQFPLKTDGSGATARLLSIPAGGSVPDHGHRGFEATLVLAGAFYDRNSWYRRGDVGIADSSVVHHPVAGPEEDCICLAVTEAPLKFRTLIPRLLQLFHGI